MKSYTDITQSKKLAEILPVESADQTWEIIAIAGANLGVPEEMQYWHNGNTPCILNSKIGIPCWSLAALLSVFSLPKLQLDEQEDGERGWFVSHYTDDYRYDSYYRDEPIDACYDLILKLHKQKLL